MQKKQFIKLKNARQNNLQSLNLNLPLNELIVVTGVSGSGKSSLAFDTVYAEGQRRYVETFSPYARQFLDRMDKPKVDSIDGIPPAIAIDQTNPVRTSRSTVGTMTELNDHLKLLFARTARLYCRGCGTPVQQDTPAMIFKTLIKQDSEQQSRALITFPLSIPTNFSEAEVTALLEKQGYIHIHTKHGNVLQVIQDRVRIARNKRDRIIEALEVALNVGRGHVSVITLDENRNETQVYKFSSHLHCAACNIQYATPIPNSFSFNSPVGACEACRGFGRTIGINYGLVVPDENKTLAEGAVRPWQTQSYTECQKDLIRFAHEHGIPIDVPWRKLSKTQKNWVLLGEGEWEDGLWYGIQGFFAWLESKSYKMHIRVLLSKYRAYNHCESCQGARLKADSLLWRLGNLHDAEATLPSTKRFRAQQLSISQQRFETLPGLTLHDVMLLPLSQCQQFFQRLHLPKPLDEATGLLLHEIRGRLNYLVEVGLGYLTLDRQSRTLSGGEVQRINLTTALGTSLVNTLFVLDEPSIGLHPRDMQRMITVLHRLRDAGNSLLVVEHDPQVMLAADRILDLGPGPGEQGGKKVFYGSPLELLNAKRSLTAQYLTGQKSIKITHGLTPRVNSETDTCLEIIGAQAHNLKNIDVRIPLMQLVCITGVSGSGKSTLIQDVLFNALCKLKGKPKEQIGAHQRIKGHRAINEVVFVDQSPIGKTTRSNPASYVGALDVIRKIFADEPKAQERGYTAGTFSFNSGTGRCPSCNGNGFEHVEMQFLSDIYIRCTDCDGKRFRAETLEVKVLPANHTGRAQSIANVLDMTVTEALAFFNNEQRIANALQPLSDVGLSYLKLGQPVPTLSGGEAQRLKLAGHLAKAGKHKHNNQNNLFLFDEPTTGLHFEDIAKLLSALEQLLQQGDSVIVIEHNLDVIKQADWVIDLGPEGGNAGGEVLFSGSTTDLLRCKHSHTGKALKDYLKSTQRLLKKSAMAVKTDKSPPKLRNSIQIHHAREHNLKNVDIEIPLNQFTVITGVSGSGKSTVAFDILFAEGQRRYLESLNAYARQFVQPSSRPDVDAIYGIPPTVAIEQRSSRGGRKSTVATMTEIYHFLRLLFVKLGQQYCPDCDIAIEPQTIDAIQATIVRNYRNARVQLLAPLVVARKGYYTDLAKKVFNKGYSQLRVDGQYLATDNWPRLDRFKEHNIELPIAEIMVSPKNEKKLRAAIERALDYGNNVMQLLALNDTRRKTKLVTFSTERACPSCNRGFDALDPRLFSFNSKHGWCSDCVGTGRQLDSLDTEHSDGGWNDNVENEEKKCPRCDGKRLRPEALAVRFKQHTITDYTAMPIAQAEKTIQKLALKGRNLEIARDILSELRSRLRFLNQVGLSYLSLDRSAPSLSGGEAQRIRLASQLGSNLQGVCYILDEPTIGLHPRDNTLLLNTLVNLQRKGNTVVVVEHDEDTISRADHVIDLGPGAGVNGGKVVAKGTLKQLLRNKNSVTGRYMANPLKHPFMTRRHTILAGRNQSLHLAIKGAYLNNLKKLNIKLPLHRLVCVSGVSGSGKSTLIRQVLHRNLQQLIDIKQNKRKKPSGPSNTLLGCQDFLHWESINRVLEVNQTPIGKTPRSCPATYIGFWDEIRKLFANVPEARIRGYSPSRFSFNVKDGRCDGCDGQGFKKIEMSFLPDVKIACDICGGSRFNQETLMVLYNDKNIGDVLAMGIDEAVEFFAVHSKIHHALKLLQDVGLGYLTLGQQSPTLSGGEAQRIKLVSELAKAKTPAPGSNTRHATPAHHTLYILDEPTIGLHMADVDKLIHVLHRLVDTGNTVVIIEHNLDMIAEADWVLDLGPEGGDGGGSVVAKGTPEDIVKQAAKSHTAKTLTSFLRQRR
ncbi:MAG: excinuclease ABC subunit UvrA [Gammaproteobacteria bacterium]|nr:excinuclease ABC subunit UvrA [Gammaproteobacteria bacterium]